MPSQYRPKHEVHTWVLLRIFLVLIYTSLFRTITPRRLVARMQRVLYSTPSKTFEFRLAKSPVGDEDGEERDGHEVGFEVVIDV